MTIVEIILLGIGLAMDCFAVSLTRGLAARRFMGGAAVMAVFFGIFQAAMPLAGYLAGTYLAAFISRIAPWVALVALGFIGGKMIYENFNSGDESPVQGRLYPIGTILVLSLATSIDALASGLVFIGQEDILMTAILTIGVCSTLFSLLGTMAGAFIGDRFKFPSELVGGIILIGIGLKIWVQGIFF